jgi:hypothetical protein
MIAEKIKSSFGFSTDAAVRQEGTLGKAGGDVVQSIQIAFPLPSVLMAVINFLKKNFDNFDQRPQELFGSPKLPKLGTGR